MFNFVYRRWNISINKEFKKMCLKQCIILCALCCSKVTVGDCTVIYSFISTVIPGKCNSWEAVHSPDDL